MSRNELFTPEYAPDGFPLLEQRDVDFADQIQQSGVLLIGDPRLEQQAIKVTSEHDYQDHLERLAEVSRRVSSLELSKPLGIAAGQTTIRLEEGPLDIFLAKVDPDTQGGKIIDTMVPFINFEITEESDETFDVKHGCLTTGPMSPILGTPKVIKYKAQDQYLQEFTGTAIDFAGAVLFHEDYHNGGGLMVQHPNVKRVNCVPQRHIEQSRQTSVEEALSRWPLVYTDDRVAAIVGGQHPLLYANR